MVFDLLGFLFQLHLGILQIEDSLIWSINRSGAEISLAFKLEDGTQRINRW